MSSMLIGNLMAAYVIPLLSNESTFFIALTALCFASACMFLCLRKPIPSDNTEETAALIDGIDINHSSSVVVPTPEDVNPDSVLEDRD
jgi:hypothetical protein